MEPLDRLMGVHIRKVQETVATQRDNLNLIGYKPGFTPNELNLIALLLMIITIAILPHGR